MAVLVLVAAPARADALEAGVVTDLTWFPSLSERKQTADLLRDSGSRWVRLSVGWRDFEPAPGVLNPWHLDAYRVEIERARSAGQRVLLMVSETPTWASGSSERYAPPRNPADYARFMGALASEYGSAVDAYEVWNEPNLARFWKPAPNPAAYARLLRAAYPAIKSADPGAPVVFAGPSTNDYEFVEAAYDAGAGGHFDVLGAHPYSCEAPQVIRRDRNGRINQHSFLGYRELRATMRAHGEAKPIWFTEFGWSTTTADCGVSEAAQAEYVTRGLALAAADDYVDVALYYNLRNNFFDGDANHAEARFGLVDTNFRPKPAYSAFRAFATGRGENRDATPKPPTPVLRLTVIRAPRKQSKPAAPRKVTARGMVKNAKPPKVRLKLQRRSASGRWANVATRTMRVRRGRFAASLGPLRPGSWRIRLSVPGRPGSEALVRSLKL